MAIGIPPQNGLLYAAEFEKGAPRVNSDKIGINKLARPDFLEFVDDTQLVYSVGSQVYLLQSDGGGVLLKDFGARVQDLRVLP